MIYFVLYTNGRQTFGCFLYLSSVAIEVANANALGALNLFEVVASPPVRFPCFYGIDMPSHEELIGSRLTPEEIGQELGVDSLGYLSLDGMLSVVSDHGSFCNACFSGNYAAPLVDLE